MPGGLDERPTHIADRHCDPATVPVEQRLATAGVKLRVSGSPRTTKAHLWVGVGDADDPYVVCDFTTGYSAAGPTRFLAGFAGYFQADALAQYVVSQFETRPPPVPLAPNQAPG